MWDEVEFSKLRGQHIAEERVIILIKGVCEALQVLHHHKPCIAHRFVFMCIYCSQPFLSINKGI